MTSYGLRIWCLALIFFVSSGCRSGLPFRITDKQLQTHGIVVGSIAHRSGPTDYNIVSFSLLDMASGTRRQVLTERVPFTGFRDDFRNEKTGAAVFAFVLPPGQYEIQKPGISNSDGQSTRTIQSKLKHPIDVRAGEIVYVGELFIAPEYEQRTPRGILTAAEWDGLNVTIYDQLRRDLGELRIRYPNVPWERAENSVNQWPVALRTRPGQLTGPQTRLVNHEESPDP